MEMEGEFKMNGWIRSAMEGAGDFKITAIPNGQTTASNLGVLLLISISLAISLSNQKFSLFSLKFSSLLISAFVLQIAYYCSVLFCSVLLIVIMEMLKLPMGCYFSPKPHECIKYLSFKVHGSENLCCFWDGLIFDCDPYNPKQLPDIFSTVIRRDNLYFFTKLRRKGKIGSVHIDRTVVGVWENKGTWRADQTKEVRDADSIFVIGSARTFTFWGKKGDVDDRRFLMTEYQLLPSNGHDSAPPHYDPLKDHVLCHLRCAPEGKGKGKKATKSMNNLKMSDSAPPPPLQSLPPQPPCPAANSDITAEAFPSCSTTPAAESVYAAYSLQTPTDSPTDNALDQTDLIAIDWDDFHNAQLDNTDLIAMDWDIDHLDLLEGTTGHDEDVLPLSSAAPLHFHADDPLALISVDAAVNPNFPNASHEPEFPDSYSASVENYSSYRHDVEPPTSVIPLATAAAVPSPALFHNPVAPFEDDYDILFDIPLPIDLQSQSDDINRDGISEFLDREAPIITPSLMTIASFTSQVD